jgi:hypothetical protein
MLAFRNPTLIPTREISPAVNFPDIGLTPTASLNRGQVSPAQSALGTHRHPMSY